MELASYLNWTQEQRQANVVVHWRREAARGLRDDFFLLASVSFCAQATRDQHQLDKKITAND